VLGVLAEECAKHGQCTLSVGKLADAAFVTNATVRRALHAARTLGLIEMPEDVIRIVSPEWQALLQAEKGRR
jgi:DNA-binding transcriptional regulator YhcF (GntR family)